MYMMYADKQGSELGLKKIESLKSDYFSSYILNGIPAPKIFFKPLKSWYFVIFGELLT